jgi:tetratricopeptide (TPR) repeat protein
MDLEALKTSIITYIDRKEFDQALQALNEIKILQETRIALNEDPFVSNPELLGEVIELLFLKSTIFELKGMILEAIEVTDHIQELAKSLVDKGRVIQFRAKVMKVYLLSLIVKIKEGQIEVEEIENLIQTFSESELKEVKIYQGILFLGKGWMFAFSGQLEEGLKQLQASLAILKPSPEHSRYVGLLLSYIGTVYNDVGNFTEALSYHKRALNYNQEKEYTINYIWSLQGIASMYGISGDLGRALKYMEKGLDLAKAQDNLWIKAWAHGGYAAFNVWSSNFKIGKEHALIALKITEVFNALEWQNYSFWYLAWISKYEGDLDQAEKYALKCLEIVEAMNFEILIGNILDILGEIYYTKGDLETSLFYYEKDLQIRNKARSDPFTARTLLNLVQLHVDLNKLEKAKEYYKKIYQLSKKSRVDSIEHRKLMAEALILKESDRFFDKGQAQQKFLEISRNDTIEGSLRIQSLFNLSELHLLELKAGGSPRIISEISSILDQLSTLASTQSLNYVMIEILLSRAKLKLIEGDISSANELLDQALLKAKKHDLITVIKRIEREKENLDNQLIQWKDMISRNADYAERLEMAQLNEYIAHAKKTVSHFPSSAKVKQE